MPPKRKPDEADDSTTDLENSILDQLGENEGDDDGDDDTEEESSEEEEDTSEGEEEGESEESDEEEDVDGERRGQDLLNLKPDKKGNLIDPKTGKIIAPSGPARRFYEDLVKSRNYTTQLTRKLNENQQIMQRAGQVLSDLKAKNDAYENASKQLGLTTDEHAEALQFMAKFKNPATAVEALKYVLTKAAQRGINIEGLSQAPLDLGVITQDLTKKIEEKFGPILDRQKASDESQEKEQRARAEIQTFLSANPDAREYFPVLVKMAQHPDLANLTLNEAWLRLQNHLLRQRNENPGLTKSRSRPGGRAKPGVNRTDGPDDTPVNVDATYKEIVREAVKDHGGLDF